MSNDDRFDEELRRMATRSLERRASAVDTDTALNEHRSRLKSPPTSARHGHRLLAAAAAVFVVAAGVVIAWPRDADAPDRVTTETAATSPPSTGTEGVTTEQSTALAGVALADALVNGDWVAIDSGVRRCRGFASPMERAQPPSPSPVGMDATIWRARSGSMATRSSNPRSSPPWWAAVGRESRGSSTPRCSPSSRVRSSSSTQRQHARVYLAVDTTLDPITPDQLVGTYTLGTTPITITPDTVTIDGCERTWSADDGSVVFEPLDCSPPLPLAMTVDEWTRSAVTLNAFDSPAGDRWVRLDRTTPRTRLDQGWHRFWGRSAIGHGCTTHRWRNTRSPTARASRSRMTGCRTETCSRNRLRRLQHVLGQRELDADGRGLGACRDRRREHHEGLRPGPPDRHVDRR